MCPWSRRAPSCQPRLWVPRTPRVGEGAAASVRNVRRVRDQRPPGGSVPGGRGCEANFHSSVCTPRIAPTSPRDGTAAHRSGREETGTRYVSPPSPPPRRRCRSQTGGGRVWRRGRRSGTHSPVAAAPGGPGCALPATPATHRGAGQRCQGGRDSPTPGTTGPTRTGSPAPRPVARPRGPEPRSQVGSGRPGGCPQPPHRRERPPPPRAGRGAGPGGAAHRAAR